jgi:hypothetical protein
MHLKIEAHSPHRALAIWAPVPPATAAHDRAHCETFYQDAMSAKRLKLDSEGESAVALPPSHARDCDSTAGAAQQNDGECVDEAATTPTVTTTPATPAASAPAPAPAATMLLSPRHDKRVVGFPPVPPNSWLTLCHLSRLCGREPEQRHCRKSDPLTAVPPTATPPTATPPLVTPPGHSIDGTLSSARCGCCGVAAHGASAACVDVDDVVATDSPRGLFLERVFCPDHASVYDALGSPEADGLKWTGLKLDNRSTKTCVHSCSHPRAVVLLLDFVVCAGMTIVCLRVSVRACC